jgi:hypothetical protein
MARFMPAETYDPRAKLATAINARSDSEAALGDAVTAEVNAFERLCDARDRLADVQAKNGSAPDDAAEVFIASMRAGLACDIAELERPSMERQAEEAELKREIDTLARTRQALETAVPIRQRAVDLARHAVDNAARAVVASSVDVIALIDEASALQEAVAAKRAVLFHLTSIMPDSADRKAVTALLARPFLIGDLGDGWQRDPTVRSLTAWRAALARDASAPAP